MLVLSRKPGETLFIGNDVSIKVLEIGQGRVRLGIEAPRDVSIYRAELMSWFGGRTSAPEPNTDAI